MAFSILDYRNFELNGNRMEMDCDDHIIVVGDAAANTYGVQVYRNGEPENISGTVKGYFVKPDGATLEITGAISGNLATVTLTSACYQMAGAFSLAIKCIGGGATTTLRVLRGHIINAATATTV